MKNMKKPHQPKCVVNVKMQEVCSAMKNEIC